MFRLWLLRALCVMVGLGIIGFFIYAWIAFPPGVNLGAAIMASVMGAILAGLVFFAASMVGT